MRELKLRDGHRQMMYAVCRAIYVTTGIIQLVGRVDSFLKAREPEELYKVCSRRVANFEFLLVMYIPMSTFF